MKKIKFLLPVILCLMIAGMSCNNSGNEGNNTHVDSTADADTIKSDPSKFSDPH